MAFLHGRRMAAALLCVQLALRTAFATKKGEPYGIVVEDAPDNIESPPSHASVQVQSLEGSTELFDRLENYQSGGGGAESGLKQVTYVKTPYAIGEPYIDKQRRSWVPIRADIGAIDETLAETGAMSLHSHAMKLHSRSRSGGSSRIWLLAPFTVGEPNYDEATKATFIPFYSAAQSKTGNYKVQSPNPDKAPASLIGVEDDNGKGAAGKGAAGGKTAAGGSSSSASPAGSDTGSDKGSDKGSATCAGQSHTKLDGVCPCEQECGNGGCTLLHRMNPFASCHSCCSKVKAMSLSVKSFDEGAAPPPRRGYLRQPAYPYAAAYPQMTPWRPPPAFFPGQPGAERYDDYAYDAMPYEYGAWR